MRALFIGLGGAGQRHLRLLKEMYPDAEVAAVRTRRRIFEIDDDLKVNENINLEEKFGIAFQNRFFPCHFLRKLAGHETTTGWGSRARRIFWCVHDLIISCNDCLRFACLDGPACR